MNWSKAITHQLSKTAGIAFGLLLPLASYSQADSSQPKSFIFSKYQLPTQGGSTVSFYLAPLKESPYKIHYKIKTLTFPADTRPEPPKSIVGAVVNGIVETAIDDLLNNNCENKNSFIVPVKKN